MNATRPPNRLYKECSYTHSATFEQKYILALGVGMDGSTWASLYWSTQVFDPDAAWQVIAASAKGGWEQISRTVRAARDIVEPVAWVVGSVLALVPGTFAIHKWIYYRRSRLPDRLDEMLREEEERLRLARTAIVETIATATPPKPYVVPQFLASPLKKVFRRFSWARWWNKSALPTADRNLDSALTEIDQQMKYWEKQHAHHKRQQAAAYLLKGAIAASNGAKASAAKGDHRDHHRLALTYFQKALEIDETDIEALEYAGHQHRLLEELDDALACYDRLIDLVNKPEPEYALIRMRTLRYQGEIYERKYDQNNVAADLGRAKRSFENALAAVPNAARDELEQAFILRGAASVEGKRNSVQLPFDHCDAAERIFLDLLRRKRNVAEADAGLRDIRELRARISALRQAQGIPPGTAGPD